MNVGTNDMDFNKFATIFSTVMLVFGAGVTLLGMFYILGCELAIICQ